MKTAIEHFETVESCLTDNWSAPAWELDEALEELRRLAERATIKQPTEVASPKHGWVCPECGKRLKKYSNFCPKCGQGLDWEMRYTDDHKTD